MDEEKPEWASGGAGRTAVIVLAIFAVLGFVFWLLLVPGGRAKGALGWLV